MTGPADTVTLLVNPSLDWGWIAIVRDRLAAASISVEIAHRTGPAGLPPLFATLELLEETLFGAGARRFARRGARLEATVSAANVTGSLIDLSFLPGGPHSALRPLFDTSPGCGALIDALLAGRSPTVALVRDGIGVASALPSVDDFTAVIRALEQVFAAVTDLVVTAIVTPGWAITLDATVPERLPAGGSPPSTMGFFGRALAAKVVGRIRSLTTLVDHWQVGYRFVDDGIWETGNWSGPPHRLIGDDRQRYYADPFPFSWSGRDFIFVEEYPYRTGVGILSVAEIRNGRATTPRPILETRYHMSYPQIFHHDGSIFMIPETSANRTVELWRCDEMPDRWERVAVLLDDVEIVDATLAVEDTGFWLLASSRPDGASACYRLGVWHAATLLGPYMPLDVAIADSRTARPGGALRRVGDLRFRPAQDCSARYGGALILCRIDRLDATGFAQTMIRRIPPPAGFSGVHTLNTTGRLETIDLCGQVRVGDAQ